jgi:glycosyltransferase involved in cell wall biosynthesis
MKILLFSEYFPESPDSEITGGVEARCFNLATRLAKKNSVTLITSWRPGHKRHDNIYGIKVIRVGPEHKYSNRAGFFSRILFVAYAIKEGMKHKDADIIDGQNWTTYYPTYLVAKKLRKPCVVTYHETWIGEWVKNKGIVTGLPYEIYERLLLKLKYDKIICVSEFTKRRLVAEGAKEETTDVIYNGINLEDFDFACKKDNVLSVCYIGRLVKTKKVDILIKAIALLKKYFPKIRCEIIGQGEERKNLEELAVKLGVKDNVNFLGFIKDTREVRRILKASKVFCLPSTVEGFGIVLLEAMASGTPYVCSDISVLKEVTENGKGGLLFEKNNEKDLSKKLLLLLKNKKEYEKKVKEGKTLVKRYQWSELSLIVENLYKEVIKEYSKKR